MVTSEKAATPLSLLASAAPRESATTRLTEVTSGACIRLSARSPTLQSLSNDVQSYEPSDFASSEMRTAARDQAAHLSSPSRPLPQGCNRATACASATETPLQPRAQAASGLTPTRALPSSRQPPQRAATAAAPCRDKDPLRDAAPPHPGTAQYEGAQTWSDITMRVPQVKLHTAQPQPPAPPSNPSRDHEQRRHEVPQDGRSWTSTGERPVRVDPRAAYCSTAAPQPPYRHPSRAPSHPCKNPERPKGAAARPSHGRLENVRTWMDVSEKWMQPRAHGTCLSPTTAGPCPAKAEALAPAAWCPDRNPPRGPPDPCRSRERPYSTPEVGTFTSYSFV